MTLAELLDNVPTSELRNALERRQKVRDLPKEKRERFENCVRYIMREHGINRDTLLSAAKHQHAVDARWALYRRLHGRGFTPVEISSATRHDRSRVYHGLRSQGLIETPAGA